MNMVKSGEMISVGITMMMTLRPFKKLDPGIWYVERTARMQRYAVSPKR
jgi:hypothetical protein